MITAPGTSSIRLSKGREYEVRFPSLAREQVLAQSSVDGSLAADLSNRGKSRHRVANLVTLDSNGQPTGTGAILPGYTNATTQVGGIPSSNITPLDTAFGFLLRSRGLDFNGEHDFQSWHFDYNAAYQRTHTNLTSGDGPSTFTHTITGVGWILDRSKSDGDPRFIQTEGPDIANPANYTISTADTRKIKRLGSIKTFRGNAQYKRPSSYPLFLKSGLEQRTQTSSHDGGNRRWNYIGPGKLPTDPTLVSWDLKKTGRNIPTWHSADFFENNEPTDPKLWSENLYFREQSKYTTTANVSEKVTAGYLLSQGKFGRLGLLAGVRAERTEVSSFGWVRAHILSSAAVQTSDPIGAAKRDSAGNTRRIKGDYTKSFPSAHLTYDIAADLKTHLSWSTGFGRPPFANLVPNETPNDAARIITVNNPALKPQYAKNWDATVEYYLKPMGLFSAGWFHKTITDYLVAGINAGTAYVQGMEFSFRYPLTFLPHPFNGLSINANYTKIVTHGNYGGKAYLTTRDIVGFIPKVANVDLTDKYRAFNSRVLVSYIGDYITTFSAPASPLNVFKGARTMVNVGLGWQVRPSANLFCETSNIFNAPQDRYQYISSRMANWALNGTLVNFGVTGRF